MKVPGATLYYEERGSGPLLVLIPGGPTDADVMSGLAEQLAPHYRVVAYDPRGNSRSVFDGAPVEQNMDVHGDDLAALVRSLGGEPVLVFGNSGGAQIGLNFTARYPTLVRRLVAHEPPCIPLLVNADEVIAQMRDVVETFHAKGSGPAMGEFMKIAGMTPPVRASEPRPAAGGAGDERASKPSERAVRAQNNLAYFLEHGVRPIGEYKPDIAKLKQSDVVVGAGRESEGQLAHRTAQALADQLGTKLAIFPNDHSGWARNPADFAKTLMTVLKDAQ